MEKVSPANSWVSPKAAEPHYGIADQVPKGAPRTQAAPVSAIDGSPQVQAQFKLAQEIQNSPRLQSQRQLASEINQGRTAAAEPPIAQGSTARAPRS